MATLMSTGNALSAAPATSSTTYAPQTGNTLLGVKPGDSNYGDKVGAALALADWDKYKALYMPLEDQLLAMVNDPNGRQNAMATAAQGVGQNMDNANDAFERQARGLGLELTAGQKASYERRNDITAGLSRVGAANMAGRNHDALRRIILGGS
jgi:hypothetical protein